MSTQRKAVRKQGVSKAKLALVAVLGLTLVLVWGNAFVGGGGKPVAKRRERPRRSADAAARPAAIQPGTRLEDSRAVAVDWPAMPLPEAVLNDPFAKPPWARRKIEESQRSAADKNGAGGMPLAAAEATMIVISGESRVATVEGRELRIGDTHEGFEVIDITRRGVVFASAVDGGRAVQN